MQPRLLAGQQKRYPDYGTQAALLKQPVYALDLLDCQIYRNRTKNSMQMLFSAALSARASSSKPYTA
jgi:hypothetical protein